MFKKLAMGTVAFAVAASLQVTTATAEESLYIPSLTYRTGPFAGGGTPVANGFRDYLLMINERDGGIGGVKIVTEECETGYSSQKGVECYEATKGKGALVYNPMSTGITLQLIPKAPVDKIPVLSMGYGLSATAVGEKFPWTFNYPATYWSQMTSILKYIDAHGGIKGKKIGFIYLDVGYGREPLPLLDKLAPKMGFSVVKFPVGVKEMQSQSSQWLNVRKERPDWMIMWGWGAMNTTAIKEAAKIRYPLDHFIGNWWSGANADLDTIGAAGKGYISANMAASGTDFPAIQDILKYVVDKGKSLVKDRSEVGKVLYNRGVLNAAFVVEGIRVAQKMTGKKVITGSDLRDAFEKIKLTQERWAEIGFPNFTLPMIGSCKDHAGGGAVFLQQWDGSKFVKITDLIPPMTDVVRPMLEEAADKYVADKPGWQTQKCAD